MCGKDRPSRSSFTHKIRLIRPFRTSFMRASRPLREEPAPPEALSVYSRAMVQFRVFAYSLSSSPWLVTDWPSVLTLAYVAMRCVLVFILSYTHTSPERACKSFLLHALFSRKIVSVTRPQHWRGIYMQ